MKNVRYAIVAFIALGAGPVCACDGQIGKVIFEDTFEDDSGGWDLSPPNTIIKPPNLLISLSEGSTPGNSNAYSAQQLTFRAKDADYCVEGTIPKALAPDNNFVLGLEFWAADYRNYWLAQVDSGGTATVWINANGGWTNVAKVVNAPGFKPAGANALRVVTLGGKVVVYLNGQLVKTIRAPLPDDALRFGIYGAVDKAVDAMPAIQVNSFKVTTGTKS